MSIQYILVIIVHMHFYSYIFIYIYIYYMVHTRVCESKKCLHLQSRTSEIHVIDQFSRLPWTHAKKNISKCPPSIHTKHFSFPRNPKHSQVVVHNVPWVRMKSHRRSLLLSCQCFNQWQLSHGEISKTRMSAILCWSQGILLTPQGWHYLISSQYPMLQANM